MPPGGGVGNSRQRTGQGGGGLVMTSTLTPKKNRLTLEMGAGSSGHSSRRPRKSATARGISASVHFLATL
jgi:hypothetical protein